MDIRTGGWVLVGGMVMAMAAVAVVLLGGPVSDMGRTDSLEPVDLTLKGHEFQVPKAYLWYKPQWDGAVENAVLMAAVWGTDQAGLRPFSEETKAFFKGGMGLPYKVSFDLFAMVPGEQLEDLYFKPGYQETCQWEREGFKVCPHPETPHFYEVLVNSNGERPLALTCRKQAVDRSPFCTVDLPYALGLKLTVGFHAKRLAEVGDIIDAVLDRVCGFRRSGTPQVAQCQS
ncbi:hypothetical protein [Magnetospira sp. QH-2]|uniref:hypothetical protein n=1 Tax=Magnetospira sp. (strain QH-2) TaxID=1288970 RepID=UPI00130DDB16|nr:hypothetical protein [Magnetospira sp. QH-2]